MHIDNSKRASKIKLVGMIVPLIVVFAVALTYLLTDVRDLKYVIIAVSVLAVYFTIMALLRLNYVVFYAGPDKIQIRYKTLLPFKSPNNSVQIKASNFHHYEMKNYLGGIIKKMTLFQNTPGGIGKYPSIGVSAMKNVQIEQMKKALDLILSLKKTPNI
jgi:low affinity Fe/Cu permease